MAEQLSVLIIGAGNKGALGPVSHAEAFTNNPAFKLVGFVDSNRWNLAEAGKRWGGDCFYSLQAALDRDIDVAVVATPDETHEEVLTQLVGGPTQFIFAEKPFTTNSEAALSLVKDFKYHSQEVMVNYTRRFVPEFIALREEIRRLGGFIGGSAFYGKNLHNLCHWVDTFVMLGVNPHDINYVDIERSRLNVFEAFLYFEGGRVDILEFGSKWRITPSCDREDYPTDRVIGCKEIMLHATRLDKAMLLAVQNIANHFSNGEELLQDAWDATRILQICEALAG